MPLLAGHVIGPIRALTRATRAVGAGHLDVEVPVTTTDELGELARSFNDMLAGLREREALREHNVELVQDLRDSRARIVAASQAARRDVERDLHDGAQQHLVVLGLKLAQAQRMAERGDPGAPALLQDARADLARALTELRDLAHGIYPPVLESDGLGGALAEAASRAAISASVSTDGAGRYGAELEAAVYFCCVEALQNAAKHAGEHARVTVRLAEASGRLSFEIADDGRGFSADGRAPGRGLQNMADRIGALGGELRVESRPGAGTRVIGSLPLGPGGDRANA